MGGGRQKVSFRTVVKVVILDGVVVSAVEFVYPGYGQIRIIGKDLLIIILPGIRFEGSVPVIERQAVRIIDRVILKRIGLRNIIDTGLSSIIVMGGYNVVKAVITAVLRTGKIPVKGIARLGNHHHGQKYNKA